MADYPKHVAGNGNETLDNNVSQNVMEHLRSVFLALSRKKGSMDKFKTAQIYMRFEL
jgi:hypothetical protein